MTNTSADWKTYLTKAEDFLADIFEKKAPALPDSAKEAIVKYGPYVMIVLLVLAVPALLGLLGLAGALSAATGVNGLSVLLSAVFLIVNLVLEGLSIPLLLKRKMGGWKLSFYSSLASAVYSLVSGNLVGLVLGTLISFYILFQIRSKYS